MKAKATVLRWNRAAGFGFLAPENKPDEDLFVHFSAIQGARRLVEGQEVEFEYGEHRGKAVARDVVIIGNMPATTISSNRGGQ
jgi:cold shock protein